MTMAVTNPSRSAHSELRAGQSSAVVPLLDIRNVTKDYYGGLLFSQGKASAIDSFSLSLSAEEPTIIAIGGESGSGKTTLANLILGFIKPTRGEILFNGRDIHAMSKGEFARYRRQVQAVFQDPYEAYNPFYKLDNVFSTAIRKFHLASTRGEAESLTQQALEEVGLRPDDVMGRYPHELSGGQRQRVMVARAFLVKPRIIVADEPVSMVDASLRGMILGIMERLKSQFGISFLYISHDLSTARQISDEIVILYRGSVIEQGDIDRVLGHPQHPYTQMLIRSIPLPDPDSDWYVRSKEPIVGENRTVESVGGCRFYDRCLQSMDLCRKGIPHLQEVDDNHFVSCYLHRK